MAEAAAPPEVSVGSPIDSFFAAVRSPIEGIGGTPHVVLVVCAIVFVVAFRLPS